MKLLLKRLYPLLLLLMNIASSGCSQTIPEERPQIQNPAFDTTIARLIRFSVPVLGVEGLSNIQNEVVIFDTRAREEFDVSHIPEARFLGYREFEPEKLAGIPKDTTIVLYCSVGYRSEKIGERLHQLGYQKVYNLYGSIFEWANRGYPIVTPEGQSTDKLHTYNKDWSQWVKDDKVEKIW